MVCDAVRTLSVILDYCSHSLTTWFMLLSGLWKTAGYVQILRSVLARWRKTEACPVCRFFVCYYFYPAYGNSILGEESGKIKNYRLRFIVCLRKYDPGSAFRVAKNLLTKYVLFRIQTCCLINRAKHWQSHGIWQRGWCPGSEVSQQGTRQDDQLHFRKVEIERNRLETCLL